MSLLGIFTAFFVFSIMISGIYQMIIINELKSRGQNPTVFYFSFTNIKKLKILIESENRKADKESLQQMYYLYLFPTLISIICFVGIIITALLNKF